MGTMFIVNFFQTKTFSLEHGTTEFSKHVISFEQLGPIYYLVLIIVSSVGNDISLAAYCQERTAIL